jgi:hypothetical protein
MKRYVRLWAVAAALAVGSITPAWAQANPDKWDVFVAPYMMGASMSGSSTVKNYQVDVDVSASDIFSNLQFGAMGLMTAMKGNWGFGADIMWMALGATVENTNVDFNQGGFAFFGLRRLGPAAELTFGARINTLQSELTFKGPNLTVSQDKNWVDPLVGIALHTPREGRFRFGVYGEVGGFGVGSNFEWQIFPTIGIGLTKSLSLEFGYRWLDMDYESGDDAEPCVPGLPCLVQNDRFVYDVLTQGPVVGFGFRF